MELAICRQKWTELRRVLDVTMDLVLRQTPQDFADCVQVCYRLEISHILVVGPWLLQQCGDLAKLEHIGNLETFRQRTRGWDQRRKDFTAAVEDLSRDKVQHRCFWRDVVDCLEDLFIANVGKLP